MHLKPKTKPRPDTATLDRPLVLDPRLLRKVDMTRLTRDRLVTIENLINTPKKTRASPNHKVKPVNLLRISKSGEEKLESWEVQDSLQSENFQRPNNSRMINTTFRVRSHVRKGLKDVFATPTNNQVSSATVKEDSKPTRSPNSKETNVRCGKKSVEEVFGTLIMNEHHVPSPCNSCGRSERPERLHAHPSVPQSKRSRLKNDQENSVAVLQQKNSVTKPVAMKFRSGKTRGKHQDDRSLSDQLKSPTRMESKDHRKVPLIRSETFKVERDAKSLVNLDKKVPTCSPSRNRKSSLMISPSRRPTLPRTPENQVSRAISPPAPSLTLPNNPSVIHSASPRRPRTMTCYLCHKQFATASFPLHESQCLQRWQRVNDTLPVSEQQATPQRPDDVTWEHAWEAVQAVMVACGGCSKTFLPHRLEAHLRVCPQSSPNKKLSLEPKQESNRDERSECSEILDGPTSVHCHICGKVFNRAAVDRHEQHCLKRWQLEHSRDSSSSAPASTSNSPSSSVPTTPRRRLVLCYLCGRQFGSASIAIHEPQCLRKWRQENERLPPAQRRPEPFKPATIYDPEGQVDYQATEDAQWQCHLVQLVPCSKCGRTFNPDRVAVHEKCCKGPDKH